ncbi:MAG: hypothetical protein NXY57DRAFT_964892 [Lentinula lateritia]|uniref:Uncharacterized protein n=1 Tax=Lentinula lateritia TaxID=40482 RepID=A0ABQ8VVW5_9AGAR|nr:MAG: hypothetical protein NXY57DRAFT_964892 [Lentinula lateritia]KAJ4499752.1 hypothetical protein C8R41DRAFT_863735 [Lentinula lateritia]
MVYSHRVIVYTVIVASSVLAVPLQPSRALSDTVSTPGTVAAAEPTVDVHNLGISVLLKDNESHPLERLGAEQQHHIDVDESPSLLGNETIFNNHTAPTHPDHTSESSNSKENQSLSSSSSYITPPGGTPSFSLLPIHIERRTTMSDKDALFYLKQCKVPARWTLTSEFRAMPDNAQNIRNSDGDWTQFKEMSKVDQLIESLQRKMPKIKPMVPIPMLVEAYYVCVRNQLLRWCLV